MKGAWAAGHYSHTSHVFPAGVNEVGVCAVRPDTHTLCRCWEWVREGEWDGRRGRKKTGTKQKARSTYSRCKDEWFHLLFYSFRRPRSGLRSDSTALTFFLIFFFSFPASCKKMCGLRLFRSDLKRRRPWVGGSESLKNVALVWVDEDQNLLLWESQLLLLLSRLRPFSTTLALATSAFFTRPPLRFSVLLLCPASHSLLF